MLSEETLDDITQIIRDSVLRHRPLNDAAINAMIKQGIRIGYVRGRRVGNEVMTNE